MAIDRRHPREIRADIRSGKLTSVTAGLGEGHVQANLAVLPKDHAYDFLLFCQRNPRACPLIEITDVTKPDWGDAQPFRPGDVPVFWACGVTPQAVALASKPPFMLTHSPGHMFITDLPNATLAAF